MVTHSDAKPNLQQVKDYLGLFKTYKQGSLLEKALDTVDQVIASQPDLAEAYKLRSEILEKMGKSDDATLAYMQFMRLDKTKEIAGSEPHLIPDVETTVDKSQLVAGTPWISILFRPQVSIRWIVQTDPSCHVILLAILLGISGTYLEFIDLVQEDNLPLPWAIILTLLLGPILGIIGVYLGGAVYSWFGQLLGGRATSDHIRAAVAWSSLPIILSLLIVLPTSTINQVLYYTNPIKDVLVLINNGLILFSFVFQVWYWVLLAYWFVELNRFSFLRAIATVAIPSLVVMIIGFLLGIALGSI